MCWKMQYGLMAVSCWKQQTFRYGVVGVASEGGAGSLGNYYYASWPLLCVDAITETGGRTLY